VPDILARLNISGSPITLRRATREDLPAIVGLLVDDPLGRTREAASGAYDFRPYETAFAAIDSDPAQVLVVATDGIDVVATMQISLRSSPAHHGQDSRRCTPLLRASGFHRITGGIQAQALTAQLGSRSVRPSRLSWPEPIPAQRLVWLWVAGLPPGPPARWFAKSPRYQVVTTEVWWLTHRRPGPCSRIWPSSGPGPVRGAGCYEARCRLGPRRRVGLPAARAGRWCAH
jgi:hypothetical protein